MVFFFFFFFIWVLLGATNLPHSLLVFVKGTHGVLLKHQYGCVVFIGV